MSRSRSRSWSRSWCECEEVRRGGLGLNQDIVADFVRKERYYGSIDFCVCTERDLFAMLRRVGSLEDEAIPIPMVRLEWMAGIFPSCQESCFRDGPKPRSGGANLLSTPLEVLNHIACLLPRPWQSMPAIDDAHRLAQPDNHLILRRSVFNLDGSSLVSIL